MSLPNAIEPTGPEIPAGEMEVQHLNPWQVAWSTGWLAANRNRGPAIVMWIFGLLLIAGYFFVPTIQHELDRIGQIKTAYGWKFSLISTAIFGGLLPALFAWLTQRDGRVTLGLVGASTLLWAYKGVEVDFFYRLQAWLFGSALDFRTIAIKTFCDQLIMVPILGMVNVVLFYLWRDCGYSFRKLASTLDKGWYRKRVLPVLIANWVIWIPAVAMIYSLPSPLQLPVQNLILCFWVLILMIFTDQNSSS